MPRWIIRRIEEFRTDGAWLAQTFTALAAMPPTSLAHCYGHLLQRALTLHEKTLIAVRGENAEFELEFPVTGVPTIQDDGDPRNPFVWFVLSGCSAAFRLAKSQQPDYENLCLAARGSVPRYVSVVRSAMDCPVDQCDLRTAPDVQTDRAAFLEEVRSKTGTTELGRQMFDHLTPVACNPDTVGTPGATCIPFAYPDAGCEAKAHRACQVLCRVSDYRDYLFKVYCARVYGEVCTENHPKHKVCWNSHIAPALKVQGDHGGVETLVLDPSLFPAGPVTVDRWERRVANGTACKTDEIPIWAARKCEAAEGCKHDNMWWRDDCLTWGDADLAVQRMNLIKRACCLHHAWPPYPGPPCP